MYRVRLSPEKVAKVDDISEYVRCDPKEAMEDMEDYVDGEDAILLVDNLDVLRCILPNLEFEVILE